MMMRSLAVGGNNLNNVRLRIIWLFALYVLPRCMIEGWNIFSSTKGSHVKWTKWIIIMLTTLNMAMTMTLRGRQNLNNVRAHNLLVWHRVRGQFTYAAASSLSWKCLCWWRWWRWLWQKWWWWCYCTVLWPIYMYLHTCIIFLLLVSIFLSMDFGPFSVEFKTQISQFFLKL